MEVGAAALLEHLASLGPAQLQDGAVGREVEGLSGQSCESRFGDEGLSRLLLAGDVDGEEFVGAQPQDMQSCTVAGDLTDPTRQGQPEGIFERTCRGRFRLCAQAELDEVTRNGYSTNRGETVPDVYAVAAPVLAGDTVLACLQVAGPASRMADRMGDIAELVIGQARRLSRRR